ncbi:antibiotic biosynthesis monooxygenase family protein [Pseudomonas citronellolis]|uniref:antibiotic biosynthesis monooxygenase family protein n=1 Tax=Pseudomonas citronellolis TaxID=53408 RepID=UPI0023E447ED|nr:antibiotic biosynthesis monooxygenase family protein [Pseudomonas citronellolis]MDF3931709.1 antibiotic biosynthesis monooxygenase [Pseudomonas citronellolis]
MGIRQPFEHHLLIQSRPGHEAALAELLDHLISAAHQLPGCQSYEVLLPATRSDFWRLRGRWADADSLHAYLELPLQQLLGEILQHHALSLHAHLEQPREESRAA